MKVISLIGLIILMVGCSKTTRFKVGDCIRLKRNEFNISFTEKIMKKGDISYLTYGYKLINVFGTYDIIGTMESSILFEELYLYKKVDCTEKLDTL